MNPLVSVIVLTYNHEEYVEFALRSACTQAYRPVEVIVLDDGSTDRTREIVRGLKGSFDFAFIENEKNIGITKSLNVALKQAKGKYIALLAGDDCWAVDKTSTQVQFMEQNKDVAVCSGRIINIDDQGRSLKTRRKREIDQVSFLCFEDFILLNSPFPAVVVMLRRDVLMQVGGYDERFIMEDTPLWLKLSSLGWKLALLPDVLGYYRLHSENLHKKRGPMFESHMRLLKEYCGHALYRRAVRAAYSRQLRFGISIGWRNWLLSIVRGFSPSRSYLINFLVGIRLSARYIRSR